MGSFKKYLYKFVQMPRPHGEDGVEIEVKNIY